MYYVKTESRSYGGYDFKYALKLCGWMNTMGVDAIIVNDKGEAIE